MPPQSAPEYSCHPVPHLQGGQNYRSPPFPWCGKKQIDRDWVGPPFLVRPGLSTRFWGGDRGRCDLNVAQEVRRIVSSSQSR